MGIGREIISLLHQVVAFFLRNLPAGLLQVNCLCLVY